jgi:ribosome-associated heat shock protein Hsp15
MESQRIDKWLWAARFYKTRGLAVEEINKGRVQLNEQAVKPARDVRPGDRISVRQGSLLRVVVIRGLSGQRGPAPAAQQLYEETEDSRLAREASAEQRRLAAEPALSIAQGRPTKRDRRKLDDAGWDERWSASIDRGR